MNSIEQFAQTMRTYDGPPIRLMEVCGTHTHSIFEYGIHDMLSPKITLISGPGCPVCVTPANYIDRAAELAKRDGWTLCTFGDMMRVPGEHGSLLNAKACGGNVRILYSPMDALSWAAAEPRRTFAIAAVGFETTLPVYALLMERLLTSGLTNVRLLTSLKAIVPALHWICESDPAIDGFLGPGHVSAILGSAAYEPLCSMYHIPLAVAGFGYEQIVVAIHDLLMQLQTGTCEAHNLYPSAVSREGNIRALQLIDQYFVPKAVDWRGLGEIAASGYALRSEFEHFDAGSHIEAGETPEHNGCQCGQVITGRISPNDCPNFGTACTPVSPLGPCMVSAEGTCGIWYANQA